MYSLLLSDWLYIYSRKVVICVCWFYVYATSIIRTNIGDKIINCLL